MGDHTGWRRLATLLAKKHGSAPLAAAKEFQFRARSLQTTTYAKIIYIVTGLALGALWPAAKADAVRTEFETGFALRLRTNKSCVHQNSRYLAVVTVRLLLVGTLRAVVLAVGDAEARFA